LVTRELARRPFWLQNDESFHSSSGEQKVELDHTGVRSKEGMEFRGDDGRVRGSPKSFIKDFCVLVGSGRVGDVNGGYEVGRTPSTPKRRATPRLADDGDPSYRMRDPREMRLRYGKKEKTRKARGIITTG
jgi:hypothetical protein